MISKKARLLNLISFVAIAVLIISCAGTDGAKRTAAGQFDSIPDDIVIIAGKIIISPAPEREGSAYMSGQIHFYLDDVMRPGIYRNNSTLEYWPKDMKLMVFEGEFFTMEMKRKKYYSVLGGYYLGRGQSAELMQMPASFALDVKKGDKAIYIGTIKYTRDLFYKWKDVEVIDEYETAAPEFAKIYGNKVKMRKALAKQYGL